MVNDIQEASVMSQGRTSKDSSANNAATLQLERSSSDRRHIVDMIARVLVTLCFVLALIPLVSLLWTVISNGTPWITAAFLSHDMGGIGPNETGGGILHAIVGTLLITLWATIISAPIGLLTAIYLVEYGRGGRLAKATTFLVDVMTGIPSIVAGLFGLALFMILFGPGYRGGIMASVALSLLMIPTVIRSSEEMLRLVPNELREAAYALGVPKWKVIVKVVLRTSIAGLTTSVMLAIARIIGETAPLLLTAGSTADTNGNILKGAMETLPIFINDQYSMSGGVMCAFGDASCTAQVYQQNTWAAALVLIIIVMALNLFARLIARYFSPKGS